MLCYGSLSPLVCERRERAVMVDWFGYVGVIITVRLSPRISKRLGKKLSSIFSYYPGNSLQEVGNFSR
jgi:hypothetical protein